MPKDDAIVQDGEILDVLPNGHYKVRLHGMEFELTAYKGGKMRKNHIKLLPGDRVQVEVNEYDISKGRIIYRYRSNPFAAGPQGFAARQQAQKHGRAQPNVAHQQGHAQRDTSSAPQASPTKDEEAKGEAHSDNTTNQS